MCATFFDVRPTVIRRLQPLRDHDRRDRILGSVRLPHVHDHYGPFALVIAKRGDQAACCRSEKPTCARERRGCSLD